MLSSDTVDDKGINELVEGERNLPLYLRRKSEAIMSLLEGEHVLEVGCGIGTVTRHLIEKGYRVVASDISRICLSIAKQRGIEATLVKIDICNINSSTNLLGRFDSAVMCTVLEHIQADDKALHNIREFLKRSGILVVLVPAYKMLFSELDKHIGHYRRYSKSEILKKIAKEGFRVEYSRYWDLLGLVGWLVKCKLMKAPQLSTQLKNPIFDKIYESWLSIESHVVLPFGLDIIVKARKV